MKETPNVSDLQNSDKYELLAAVEHEKIKEFVIRQAVNDKKLVPFYMVYQSLLLLMGLFFFTRALVLAFKGIPVYLMVTLATLLFCFTLLVAVHELLHALALLIAGARRVTFGASFRKFIFYAEADHFVLGKSAFFLVAFAPLIIIQAIAIAGIIIWYGDPLVYFFLLLMAVHSLFCAGDLALAAIFMTYPDREVFTYDHKEERKSYYFVEKQGGC